ncbi:TatD family hydrolase [Catenovulum sp. 2E275]|uniref:TatD family hydrolase n=1 Tax=Catenovulum sp. 2E275 TaxID=2980497 RepID=UPI0021D068D5|nr:TatD family hydrolase [Catenovulum sp. 2E275]MCU4675523.1 TatD family hydrolase [Catenovulum sp. 2E275]
MAVEPFKTINKTEQASTEQWFDIGVNLTNSQFSSDYHQQIELAKQAGVARICITGTNERESHLAAQMAGQYQNVYSTAGVHPHDAKDVSDNYLSVLKALYLDNQQVKAIGECGLDFNRNYSPQEQQLQVFSQQLDLAIELNAPVFLHQRDAHTAFIEVIKPRRNELKQVVVHCFTGNRQELEDYLALDCFIGITGWICDERRGKDVLELVNQIPLNRLLIETDAPFLLPRNLTPKPKDKRNLPLYLPHIAEQIAAQFNITLAELSAQTFANASEFFNIDEQVNG